MTSCILSLYDRLAHIMLYFLIIRLTVWVYTLYDLSYT